MESCIDIRERRNFEYMCVFIHSCGLVLLSIKSIKRVYSADDVIKNTN